MPTASLEIPEGRKLSSNHFLYFRIDRKMVKVFLDDILYIESDKDYIIIRSNKMAP